MQGIHVTNCCGVVIVSRGSFDVALAEESDFSAVSLSEQVVVDLSYLPWLPETITWGSQKSVVSIFVITGFASAI